MVLYATSKEIEAIRKKVEEIIELESNCLSEDPSLLEEKKKIMEFIKNNSESESTKEESIIFEIVNLMPLKESINYRYKPKTVIVKVEEECVLDELEKHNINIDQLLEGKVSFAWLQSLNRLCNLPESRYK